MSFEINARTVDDVTILDCKGRITQECGSGMLRSTVIDHLQSGKRKLLLNLGDLTSGDATELGELVSAYITTANHNGQLKLLNVQARVHDFLKITKLYTIFECFTDEAKAAASFDT